jgi:hypothetical protein
LSWHDATVNSLPPLVWPPVVAEDAVDAAPLPQPLGLIEARLPPVRRPPPEGGARMLQWHVDPPLSVDSAAQFLAETAPAVAFVMAEERVPVGGRPRAIPDLARRSGGGHVLAIAGLAPRGGDALAVSSLGLISPHLLYKLGLERLPGPAPPGGIGSPTALFAQLELDGVPVSLVAARLESGAAAEDGSWQVAALLGRIDRYGRLLPALVALELAGRAAAEPMLEPFRRRGFARPPPRAAGDAAAGRWLLARGLACRAAAIPPAPGGHDAIGLRVALP